VEGLLLDTHALYWLVRDETLSDASLVAIAQAQTNNALWVSPVTAWEMALAAQKPAHARRPDLGDSGAATWFRDAIAAAGARVAPIRHRIALGAAQVADATGHKDPADCFLIATARTRRIPLVTRDDVMLKLARDRGGYLSIIRC
jgi:PIN domain nuclease of toxin-antitoxin system